jgi:hypothetical protein
MCYQNVACNIVQNITVAIDTEGTNILHYRNRSYLCIHVKLNTLRDNKY